MKVYIVIMHSPTGMCEVLDVFDQEEKAKNCIIPFNECKDDWTYSVIEREVK